jgi:hypothetical protein
MPVWIEFSSIKLQAILWERLTFPNHSVAWASRVTVLQYQSLQTLNGQIVVAIPERNDTIVASFVTNLKVELWKQLADKLIGGS